MTQRRWQRWTGDEIDKLIVYHRDGYSPRDIAARLQRTEAAVRNQLHALGLPIIGYHGWRDGESCSDCSRSDRPKAAMGRCATCYARLRRQRRRQEQQYAALAAGYRPADEVAQQHRVALATVLRWARSGKVPSVRVGRSVWVRDD